MTQPLFERVLLPVADRDDAIATCTVAKPYLNATEAEIIVLHVTSGGETTDGDESARASSEPAERISTVFHEADFAANVSVTTEPDAGVDVVEAIVNCAENHDVTAIGVRPRPKNRLVRLFSSDRTKTLVSSTDLPIVIFPRDERSGDGERDTSGESADGWSPTLLVPVDASRRSLAAIEFACTSFETPEVIALHVQEPAGGDVYSEITPGVSSEFEDETNRRRKTVESVFAEAQSIADTHGVDLTTKTVPGETETETVRHAMDNRSDVIVIDATNPDDPDERNLETTASSLVRNAPVPVVVI